MVTRSSIVEALSLKVEDLLAEVQSGRVRVPRFQRGLKWKQEDNRLLFDSILRGYPIGALLVWRKPAPADRVAFGGLTLDAPDRADAWWVVDGQQRITALASALLGEGPRRASVDFIVDTRTGEVRASSRHPASEIPLSVLASTERLIPFLHAHPSVDISAASALSKRLREYPLPVTILSTDDEAFVKQVFKRLNSSGKPLRQVEIFHALHAGLPAIQSLEAARKVGQRLDFGELDDEVLVRAFKVLAGHDPLGELEMTAEMTGELIGGADFIRATEQAILFLKKVAQIPSADLLPYSLPVGVLIAFFARHPAVSERNRALLGYWFWRGVIGHRFGGDFTSIRRFFQAVDGGEDEAVQGLLATVRGEWIAPDVRAVASFRPADGKIIRLTMIAAGPRDLREGRKLDARRAEPVNLFRMISHPLARTVVNRILHPSLPPRQLVAALNVADEQTWSSHLLGDRSFDDPGAFLNSRAEVLQAAVHDFVDRMTGRFDTDRPPLEHLLGAVE